MNQTIISTSKPHNQPVGILNDGNQLEWVTTDYLCTQNTKYKKYTDAKKDNGRKSHLYFIDALKDGTFFLHTVEFGTESHVKHLSQIHNTHEEAEKAVNQHYADYLASEEYYDIE